MVTNEEEEELCEKLLDYYKMIYPGFKFSRKTVTLTKEQVGELYYTYPGEESEVTAVEKMRRIDEAISKGYSTPVIILRKKNRDILLDGHRRIRIAFSQGLGWKTIVISPDKEAEFGIEEMIMGKVKDLYGEG